MLPSLYGAMEARCEARAVAPGIPELEEQERRDRVPLGTYSRLYDAGQLEVAENLQVQPPAAMWDLILATWGKPQKIVLDRFRLAEFEDAVRNKVRLEPRVTRMSEAAADIRALRSLALDGPLSVDEDSQALLATSISRATIKSDESGSFRLVKRGTNNTARDDCAAALLLAAGALARRPEATGVRSVWGLPVMSWRRGERPKQSKWWKVRVKALDRDGWKCACGRSGKLEVHHLLSIDRAPEKMYDLDNLQALCRDCHIRKHGGRVPSPEVKEWQRYLLTHSGL